MLWARLLAYVSGTVDQELLLRNEYLTAENRILRGQIKGRLLLSEGEKATLAEIAHRLGRKVLEDVAAAAKPDTILGWYRKLIANKFDGLVGMDFFTTEVLTFKGLTTYYVLFFIHLETRRVNLAGFTPYPDQEWMEQQARNITMEEWGSLSGCCYLLHDRDAKFC